MKRMVAGGKGRLGGPVGRRRAGGWGLSGDRLGSLQME